MKKYSPFKLLPALLPFTFQFVNGQAIYPLGTPTKDMPYKQRDVTVTTHKTNQMDEATLRQKMKEDGLLDPVIDKLIAQRKLWMQKGNNFNYNWTSVKNAGQNPIVNAPCQGLGVESGWGAWMWQEGGNSGANPATWTGPPAANPATAPITGTMTGPGFTITSGAGIDPNTPGLNPGDPTIPVVCPGFGNNSIKIGDDCGWNSNCQQLTYPLTVTAQDTNFVFAYAVVLEDAGHLQSEQPFVQIAIYDQAGNTIACVPLIYFGGPSIPGFYPVNGTGCASTFGGQYKPWTLVGVNLNSPVNYVGQTLNVVITNNDCIYGGHFAYSYWDFLCSTSQLSAGCFGNQSTVCGPIDPNIAYTYTWSLNGVPIPPPQGNQQCITVTPQPGDTITVEVGQPSNCNFHLMYIPASVQPSFTNVGSCGTYTFSNTSTASPASVTMTGYNWSFPGGNPASATTPTATVTYPNAGTYTVTLTVTCSAGCTASTQTVITVTSLPTAQFNPSLACIGLPITLTNNSVSPVGDPITQWSWFMPGGSPTAGTGTVVTTAYLTAGTYTVTLTVTTAQGCVSTTNIPVTPYNPPVANFTGAGAGCAPVCVTNYVDASTPGDGLISSWQWNFPGGTPSAVSGQNPNLGAPVLCGNLGYCNGICYKTAGTYSASLTVISQYGCPSTKTITPTVTVYAWPNAYFNVTPDIASISDPTFNFYNLWSNDVTQWTWDFGDGVTNSTDTMPVHSYLTTIGDTNDFRYITICLNVQNINGCWDTICKKVELLPEYEFYIPNTFTPNSDFMNEFFFGKGRGIKEYHFWIFDRWGNLIFECYQNDSNVPWDFPGKEGLSSHADCKWNGKVDAGGWDMSGGSNQLMQEDVCVWKVKLTDVFDKKHTYVGHVNIVK